jgi:hypothetical protein
MFAGYRVIVVCPAGRRHVADLMRRHVERERHIVDEFHWWLNTDCIPDLEFFRALEAADPEYYRTVGMGWCKFKRRHMQIGRFFRFAIAHDAIYVRIDDDVVWMVEGCIEAMVRHRLAYPDAYLIYANIVNSSLFMHLHQKQGAFDPGFEIEYAISHPTNRLSVPAALGAHGALLADVEAGGDNRLEPWRFDRHVFGPGIYNDVNMISWFGRDFAAWRGICPQFVHEEQWICLRMPAAHGCRIHESCGAALCAHYASAPQWVGVEAHPEILERYRRLAPPELVVPRYPAAGVAPEPAPVSLPDGDPVS